MRPSCDPLPFLPHLRKTRIKKINRRYPEAPIFAVGFSLGANLLVKYLGEEGRHGGRPLAGAVAVSNPWNFENNHLSGVRRPKSVVERIMSKFYSLALTAGLKVESLFLIYFCYSFFFFSRGTSYVSTLHGRRSC